MSLSPTRNIGVQDWMAAPPARAVMAALGGGEDPEAAPVALFVGGCVRNALLDVPVGDIDIATVLPPDEVIRRLEAAGLRAVPTGLAHGTVTAVADGKGFEITTLRRDLETDGRHARVGFTQDWGEDARRRDFTLNTLLADSAGNVYDPLGCGLDDLSRRRVVFVGEAAERIAEDRLRVLRFFRFYGAYGRGAPDAQALAACREAAEDLKDLSRERVTQEFLKILSGPDPAAVLALMFENRVLRDLAHRKYSDTGLRSLCILQEKNGLFDVSARLALLCGMDRAHVPKLERLLILSGALRGRILACIEAFAALENGAIPTIKALIYKYGNGTAMQAVLLAEALDETPEHRALVACIGALRDWRAPKFPVSGEDVLKQGVPPGPKVGRILAQTESWWLGRDCLPEREETLGILRDVILKT